MATDDPDPRELPERWDMENLTPYIERQRAWVQQVVARTLARPLTKWRLARSGEDDIVHVLPVGDPVLHEESEDCVCGPATRLAGGHEDCDHPDIWVHQHHAIDGRPAPHLR